MSREVQFPIRGEIVGANFEVPDRPDQIILFVAVDQSTLVGHHFVTLNRDEESEPV